jgi:hypothetical protein
MLPLLPLKQSGAQLVYEVRSWLIQVFQNFSRSRAESTDRQGITQIVGDLSNGRGQASVSSLSIKRPPKRVCIAGPFQLALPSQPLLDVGQSKRRTRAMPDDRIGKVCVTAPPVTYGRASNPRKPCDVCSSHQSLV